MNMRDPALQDVDTGSNEELRELGGELVRTFVPDAEPDEASEPPSRPAGGGKLLTRVDPPGERSSFYLRTAGHGWQRFFVEDLPEEPPAESRRDPLDTRQRDSATEPADPDHPVSDTEDQRLLERFAERLVEHSGIELENLRLRVEDRCLHLAGEMPEDSIALVEEVAEEIEGLDGVDNRITAATRT